MKTLFSFLVVFIFSSTQLNAQIHNGKHYKNLLAIDATSFIVQQETTLSPLNLSENQLGITRSILKNYYQELRAIQRTKNNKEINVLRRNIEWNYAEHQMLMSIEQLLSTDQKKVFAKEIYPDNVQQIAFRAFRRTMLEYPDNNSSTSGRLVKNKLTN